MTRLLKASPSQSWDDGSPAAPKTPWGPAQDAYNIAPGVRLFMTEGHGGLRVTREAAKLLSGAARKLAEFWGGAFWFEEDVAINMPLIEMDEWERILHAKVGGSRVKKEVMERSLRSYLPRYFQLLRQGYKFAEPLKVGDRIQFQKETTFRSGTVFVPGDLVLVSAVTRSVVSFVSDKSPNIRFQLRMQSVIDEDVVKVASRQKAAKYPLKNAASREAGLGRTGSRLLPAEVRRFGTDPIVPDGTDLAFYHYAFGGVFYTVVYQGTAEKPLWHYSFKTEEARQHQMDKTTQERRQSIQSKQLRLQDRRIERRTFQHGLVIGDILYSSWGYDQTNISYYEVTEIRGKLVELRRIRSRIVKSEGTQDLVMPIPGSYDGHYPVLRKIPRKGHNGKPVVVLSSYESAFLWDGKPKSQTAFGYGH